MAKKKKGLLGLSNTNLLLIGGGIALYFFTSKKNEAISGMKKDNSLGYNGYGMEYKNTYFIIWNGSFNTNPNWYITVRKSDLYFSEEELDYIFKSKNSALQYILDLINKKNDF